MARQLDGSAALRALGAALDCVVVLDGHGRVVELNRAAEDTFGVPRSRALGRSAEEVLGLPLDQRALERLLDARVEVMAIGPGGAELPVELAVTEAGEGGEPLYVAWLRDVAERRAVHDRLVRQAIHDPLTGLPNRRLLMDRLTQALGRLERSQRLTAVMFLDLDGFKPVNDSLGHAAGDELLIEAARRWSGAIRPGDTLARVAGDEFAVLCEGLPDRETARVIARRLRDSLEAPMEVAGHAVQVSVSIGAAFAAPGDTSASILDAADAAMYRSKHRGRGRAAAA